MASGQARRWCFTYFWVEDREEKDCTADAPLFIKDHERIKYAVWQLERCPETRRLHLQGYIEFNSPRRLLAVKTIIGDPRVSLMQSNGTRAHNIAYCTKLESRVEGPWYIQVGDEPQPGKRNDLHVAAAGIRDGASLESIMEESPHLLVRYARGFQTLIGIRDQQLSRNWRTLRVFVYYGDAGTGKTRKAIEDAGEDYYILDQGERVWFDGYSNQKTLIIDDFYGWIKYGMLLRILDGYQYRCEIKGSFAWAQWTTVVLTSNKRPSEWYQTGLTPALERRINEVRHFTMEESSLIDNKSDW